MGLKARILKVTALEGGGPRNRNVLATLPRTPVQVQKFDQVFKALLAAGELVMYGDKRGAVYGPPWLTRRRGQWVELATVPHAYREDGTTVCLVCGGGMDDQLHQQKQARRH